MKITLALLAMLPVCVAAQTLPVSPYPYTQPVYPQQAYIVVAPRNNLEKQVDMRYEQELIKNKALENQFLQREIYKDFSAESLPEIKQQPTNTRGW